VSGVFRALLHPPPPPWQPTIADVEGNINNLIDVSEFRPYTVWDSDPKDGA
jgi:hypothetical protein